MKFSLGLFLALSAAPLGAQQIIIQPYVQPGDGSTLGATDVKVIAWMTDQTPGDFTVEFDIPVRAARPQRTTLDIAPGQQFYTYATHLAGLPFNRTISYRVKLGDRVVREGAFATRKTPDQPLHFVVTGDLAEAQGQQRPVAVAMAAVQPDFALFCGDLVYKRGRLAEHLANFWSAYCNPDQPDPAVGAPLLRSVPLYAVLGNHDTEESDLATMPDAFAAFYLFHPPRNSPATGPWVTPIPGSPEQVAHFEAAARPAGFPHLSLYNFDNGPAHFLVLDSAHYAPLNDPAYREWIRRDLAAAKAVWKFVFFHHPAFNSNPKHFADQRMRQLAPLFEEGGVDLVFSGHVHDYQRSRPLRFTPAGPAAPGPGEKGVRGTIKLDLGFNGLTHTVPDGIIYIVTGAGGAGLYARPCDLPDGVVPDPDAPVSYTAKYVDDRHSLTLVDLDARRLTVRQFDAQGAELDRLVVTKPAR